MPQPLRQFFEFRRIHLQDKFLTMNAMNGKNMNFTKDNFVTPVQSVQTSLDKRIVDCSAKVPLRPLADANPKVLTPATRGNRLIGQRNE